MTFVFFLVMAPESSSRHQPVLNIVTQAMHLHYVDAKSSRICLGQQPDQLDTKCEVNWTVLCRSHAQVSPGPACSVTLEGPCPIQRLAATNGSSRDDRVLLEAPIFQARDSFGNPVASAGLQVVLHLAWTSPSNGNQDLPSLETPHLMISTDKSGRVDLAQCVTAVCNASRKWNTWNIVPLNATCGHLQVKVADVVIAEGTGQLPCKENTSLNVEGGLPAEMILSLRPAIPQQWHGYARMLSLCKADN